MTKSDQMAHKMLHNILLSFC